jgi:hypothetical protein
MFAENFEDYAEGVSEAVRAAGPRVDVSDPPAPRGRRLQTDEAPTD